MVQKYICHSLMILFLLCCSIPYIYAQNFKTLGMKDGLSQPSVLAIYQDTLGRMWFGTREGVNVYDGKQMMQFKREIAEEQQVMDRYLSGNEVNRIVGDRNGDVFMRVERALVKYDIRNETFSTLRKSNVGAIDTFQGEVWCTVRDSLFRYNDKTEILDFVYKLNLERITSMLVEDSKLWIGTSHGLYLKEKDDIRCLLPAVEIYRIFRSSRDELWIASRMQGLYHIKRDGKLRKAPVSDKQVISNQIRELVEDEQQNIWFGTFNGLQVYNPYTDMYCSFTSENRPGTLTHSSVFSLYKDRQGTIWIGTYYGGINYFNQTKDVFYYYAYDKLRNDCLNFPFVGNMLEDEERTLWICTDGGGINCLNRKSGEFNYYTASDPGSILHNNVKTIAYDGKRGYIYVGTYTGGMSRYDRRTKRFYNYITRDETTGNSPDEIIYQILFRDDKLYVSARNGFWVLDPDTNEFELLNNTDLFLTFEIDSKDNVWLATRTSLFRIHLGTPGKIKRIEPDSLGIKCRITKILEGADGLVYMTTLGGGLLTYDYVSDKWVAYTVENNNMLSNYCYNLAESPKGNLLITSDKGLTVFSPLTKSVHSIELGIKGGISAVADGCGIFVSRDEQIFVGGVDGMLSFREEDLYVDDDGVSGFYFSDLLINNTKIYPKDKSGILQESLPFMHELKLSPKQNNLVVNFSSSNYVDILRNTWYQYKLEGFDNDWILTTQTSLHYTNLSPGRYVLKVRETANSLNEHQCKEIALVIMIDTPWYNTLWAWIMYIACTFMVVYWIWRVKMTRKILSLSLEKEKTEKERIAELNQMKLRFFTNISHEFRTPLTLIIGQIETLLQLSQFSSSVQKQLLRVHKNAMHLRNLITELLDFRKQEQGFLKLKVVQKDVVEFVKEIYLSFDEFAKRKRIKYVFEDVDKHIDVWFDPAQMQKAVFNLLSNAFKYTDEGGNIKVGVRKLQQLVEITVEDTGCGISEEEWTHIFDRFYQADNNTGVRIGTGIGLALTKGIVESHKGRMEMNSEVDKGSVFKIYLPLGNEHFSPEELRHENVGFTVSGSELQVVINEDTERPFDSDVDGTNKGEEIKERPTILLVEDDLEILDMLEQIFSPAYHVCKAINGQEGFDMACQLQPDIILSDVMMPVMSGKELCYKIKNSIELSYIPVVLLTAQSSTEQMVEGYMFGADDYIIKPFNVRLLLTRCGNLLKNRQSLLKKMAHIEKIPTQEIGGLTAVDKKLVDTAVEIIKRNFDNPDFDMDMLAAELNLGRSKMFARLKEVVGLTPNEFTLKLKLEEALRLLKEEPQCNVSEISYKLGFNSPRYFSQCFKTFYGVSPQNYRKTSVKK